METISQAPQLSNIEVAKRSAMQTAFEKIESLVGDDTRDENKANVAKKLLEDLRSSQGLEGKRAYRMEQALAKLEEYFRMESELSMRKSELVTIFPGLATKLAANDSLYTTSPEDRFKVA